MLRHRILSGPIYSLLLVSACISLSARAQETAPNEWTWMSGSSQNRQPAGVYGQLGVPASGNTPGGREGTISWTDTNGNFWLFGSQEDGFDENGVAAYLDDVWEYNPSTQEWSWMAGSSSVPSDSSNGCIICAAPPVFGNYQTPASGNTPGSPQFPAQWTDRAGNLWVFGGFEYTNVGGKNYVETMNAMWEFNVSSHQWAWMGGTNSVDGNAPGVYGTLGEPAAVNTPGGRTGAVNWIDSSGNFWLFGGYGQDSAGNSGYLNDLWMFTPSNNQWTWMGGSNSTFSGACLTEAGTCSAPGVPGTLQTPAAGNVPQGRSGAVIWTDMKGNVWLFGGTTAVSYDSNGNSGFEGVFINDLWEFNSTTHEWAWMSGNAAPTGNAPEDGNTPGVYGTLGAPSADNTPGGRVSRYMQTMYTWTDSNGNLWLFGGNGYDSTTRIGELGDLWRFDTSQNEWTWMGGSSTFTAFSQTAGDSQLGAYGALGTPAAGNTPGSRGGAVQWSDQSGNFWFFGGWGTDSVGTWGYLDDLWEFSSSTDEWTWMGGSNTVPNDGSNSQGQYGVYGYLGVQASTNMPGGRTPAASWTDGSGHFWIFGGYGCGSNYCEGWLNDLWTYQPATPISASSFGLSVAPDSLTLLNTASGVNGTATVTTSVVGSLHSAIVLSTGSLPNEVAVNFIPTSIDGAGSATMTIDVGPDVAPGTYTISVIGSIGSVTNTASFSLTVAGVPPPAFNPQSGTYPAAQTVTMSDVAAGATIYYTTNGTAPTTSSAVYSGPISVTSSKTILAMAAENGQPNSEVASANYIIGSATALGEWTWMSGSTTVGTFSSCGSLGTASQGNDPGGRSLAASWTDHAGNLWLFGGEGADSTGAGGYLNDLWEFNPSTNEWACIGGDVALPSGTNAAPGVYGTLGTPAQGNVPGGRVAAVTWTDANGNLWLFGGYSTTLGYYNDLWEFNRSLNQWAWMSGSNTPNQSGMYGNLGAAAQGNTPGARAYAVSWVDMKGNLWLFGGIGYDSAGIQGNLNDLWEFSVTTGQWTWVNGANAVDQLPVPGTLQTPAPANVPAARNQAVGWTDSKGNFWLFGGIGINYTVGPGVGIGLNDLWEYDPNTNEWAWMSGVSSTSSIVSSQPGVYGTLQVTAASNVPGSRTGALGWTDSSGNLWLFGGVGADSADIEGLLNDLWQYNTITNEWTWMGGSSVTSIFCPVVSNWCGQLGDYGILQTPSLTNVPGGRFDSVGWTDPHGNFWLFGGSGLDGVGYGGSLNDLWEFQPGSAGLPVTANPVISPGSGAYTSWQSVTMTDATPWATIEYEINGVPPVLTYDGPITVNTSETIEAMAFASGHANSAITTATYTANLPAAEAPTFSPSSETLSTSQTVTISDATPGATIYYAIGEVPTLGSSVYTGPITVSSSEIVEAIAVANGYQNSSVSTSTYNLETSGTTSSWTWMGGTNAVASSCYSSAGAVLSCARPGWYGMLGQSAAGNIPGGRDSAVGWVDSSGRFWMFGGLGFDAVGNQGYLSDLWMFNPPTAQWTWMGGSSTLKCAECAQPGVYGTLGTPAAANVPGGRAGATGWTDQGGHFWLFGGEGADSEGNIGYLNDLWEFDPSSQEWTWQGGSNTLSFVGLDSWGARGVYGTIDVPASGNVPGGREYAAGSTDAVGNFWLYGGEGSDTEDGFCYLNDLWKFNVAQKQWSWQAGSKFCPGYEAGYSTLYGTLGNPSIGNNPGSLASPSAFSDGSGNLWLFGGFAEDTSAIGYFLNDMWEFYPAIDEWAWESANSAGGSGSNLGDYGILGSWTAANIPSGRSGAASWTDHNGDFWLFSGSNAPTDLWEFKPSIDEWAWVGGSITGLPGNYGTLGSPAQGNIPGGRGYATTWTDSNGNLWLFGGQGFDAQKGSGLLNDVWQYGIASLPSVAPPSRAAEPTFSLAAGTFTSSQTVIISDQTLGATVYYATDGTTPNSSSPVYAGQITVSSSETIQAVAVAAGYANSAVASATYTIPLPPPTFTFADAPTSLTVSSGSQQSTSLTVTPQNGFNATVSFACSGLPANATCSFNPTTVTPSGAAATTQLTIAVNAQASAVRPGSRPFMPATGLAIATCFFFWRRRRLLSGALVLALVLAGVELLAGCGGGGAGSGGGSPGGGSPQSYTVTVTATSGTIQQTATVTLTEN
jgi:N-acetylneuraminic acid mutarotase